METSRCGNQRSVVKHEYGSSESSVVRSQLNVVADLSDTATAGSAIM
jgi:hypothetical protein